jgi:hypothetical protein
LICCFAIIFEYMVWPMSASLLIAWFVEYIAEFAVYGVIVGLVYRHRSAVRRTAVV